MPSLNRLAVRSIVSIPANEPSIRLFTVQTVFLGLSFIFVCLRAYVRIGMMKKVLVDDYLMFVAMLLYTAYSIIVIHSVILGGTDDSGNLTIPRSLISLRAWYICETLYAPISALIRTSIALLLLRVAAARLHKRIIWANMVTIWVLSVVYFFITLFQCTPPSYYWERIEGKTGSCVDGHVTADVNIVAAVLFAVCDWVLGLLPVAILWDVRLNRRTKGTLAVLLGLGMVAGVALVVRIPLIPSVSLGGEDYLVATVDTAIWTVLEPSLGIIAGCAATLRPLFENYRLGIGSRLAKRYGPRSRRSSAYAWPGPSSRRSRMQKIEDATGEDSQGTVVSVPTRRQGSTEDILLQEGEFWMDGLGERRPENVYDRYGPRGSGNVDGFDFGHAGREDGVRSWDVERGIMPREMPSDRLIAVRTSIDLSSQRRFKLFESRNESTVGGPVPVISKDGL